MSRSKIENLYLILALLHLTIPNNTPLRCFWYGFLFIYLFACSYNEINILLLYMTFEHQSWTNSECAAVRLQQAVCILPALCSRKQSPSQEKNRSKQR